MDISKLRELEKAATPLPDTGHSQECQCEQCVEVWAHGSGIYESVQQIVNALPALLDCAQELQNIVNAKPWDRDAFPDAESFVEWVRSRARFTLSKLKAA